MRGSVEVLVGVGRPCGSCGVVYPGKSLAGACRSTAAVPVTVAFFFEGAIMVICASSFLWSRDGGVVSNSVFRLWCAILDVFTTRENPSSSTGASTTTRALQLTISSSAGKAPATANSLSSSSAS